MEEASLKEKPSLTLTRDYAAPPERVWQAWTDAKALKQWWGPSKDEPCSLAELDVRVGGRYHIRFFTTDGEDHDVSGVYQEVEPHRRLSFTWAWKSTPERVSLVTLELTAVDGGTRLDFLHERFFDRQAAENHQRGWTATFAKLDQFLATC